MAKTRSSGVNLSRCSSTLVPTTHQGFMEAELEADEASLAIQEAYPHCRVLPISKLTVNQTGIDNGDINYFTATFGVSAQAGWGWGWEGQCVVRGDFVRPQRTGCRRNLSVATHGMLSILSCSRSVCIVGVIGNHIPMDRSSKLYYSAVKTAVAVPTKAAMELLLSLRDLSENSSLTAVAPSSSWRSLVEHNWSTGGCCISCNLRYISLFPLGGTCPFPAVAISV